MAVPSVTEADIAQALAYIDERGVPGKNESTQYTLVTDDGKTYPPKYVLAVARHLAYGTGISTADFNAVEAKNYFISHGFTIETKQEKFQLVITRDAVTSTDSRFTMDDLGAGDNYVPLDTYMKKATGEIVRRRYAKGERKCTNQTMAKVACQVFQQQIAALSPEEKEQFPICRYTLNGTVYRGIFPSVERYTQYRKTIEHLQYPYGDGRQFVMYSWNIFSTIVFVQECLKRFGTPGDSFVLIYREKVDKEPTLPPSQTIPASQPEYRNPNSRKLLESKNIIFRGAPGTGKSYLAKEIAADIISNGYLDDYEMLTDEQKKQVEFVQFHPSYDYSDFVEGLRPRINEDGTMGFELQDGIFKKFVTRARKNYEDSQKPKEAIEKELSAQEALADFLANVELGVDSFQTINGNVFYITGIDNNRIHISIPGNAEIKALNLNMDEIRMMLESEKKFEKIKDITKFFGKAFASQAYSYYFSLYKAVRVQKKAVKVTAKREELKKYIFIIDEINRGEISKIFGELFFAIDPGYRGRLGEVSTQYANLHSNPDEKFYIPENVYIIGTMNDIDRSVDSFDFAMRRRFRFIELRANDRLEMLSALENEELMAQAVQRMTKLNEEIVKVPELNENYQIGASYFLKLNRLTFDELWTDYLKPLLQEYIRGIYGEEEIMKKLEVAYGYNHMGNGYDDEATQAEG